MTTLYTFVNSDGTAPPSATYSSQRPRQLISHSRDPSVAGSYSSAADAVGGPATSVSAAFALQSPGYDTSIGLHDQSTLHGVVTTGQPCLASGDGRVSEMEKNLKRSVTVIVWYKANVPPLRLHHPVPTFPLFQLSHLAQLVHDLALTPTSYIDSYKHGHWEQHLISTVRTVRSEDRLLYKVRKNLIDGLNDADCPGLNDEFDLQLQLSVVQGSGASGSHSLSNESAAASLSPHAGFKRSAPDTDVSGHRVNKQFITAPLFAKYAAAQNQLGSANGQAYPQHLSTPGQAPSASVLDDDDGPDPPSFVYSHASPSPSASARPAVPQSLEEGVAPIPYTPHPPLKRFPIDYTVAEVADGFVRMDTMRKKAPALPIRHAFERVFGCRYVKSTACRHRAVWKKAPAALRDEFVRMGTDEAAMWTEFVRRAEGRTGRGAAGEEETIVIYREGQGGGQPAPMTMTMPGEMEQISSMGTMRMSDGQEESELFS